MQEARVASNRIGIKKLCSFKQRSDRRAETGQDVPDDERECWCRVSLLIICDLELAS